MNGLTYKRTKQRRAKVSTERIASILGEPGVPLEQTCRRLVDAANQAGGPDNITALVIAFDVP